jgi:formiminoglutamate deiminase
VVFVPESTFLAELAWLGPEEGVARDVLIRVDGGRIAGVEKGVLRAPPRTTRLSGVTLPGFVNAHSHAFHRALRGRSETRGGDFWTWRELMYEMAQRLDPDSYLELATAAYAEMALAGVTAVGEFHYLHHGDKGAAYEDPNEMGKALIEAAQRAGIRITLIDTCFLRGGLDGQPLLGTQMRFGDGSGERWSWRVDQLLSTIASGGAGDHVKAGAAIHSVRAVAPAAMATVATYAARHELPLHVHLSEQRKENDDCLAEEGCTPTVLLERAGALTSHTTAIHATHLLPHDMTVLGLSATGVCACPTTERDLADGVGPFSDLVDSGSPLCLGSDTNAVIDMFEEMRAVELNERLVTNRRGIHKASDLLAAATSGGAQAIGWHDAGRLRDGALADLVTVSLDSPRLAAALPTGPGSSEAQTAIASPGTLEAALVFAAGAADVRHVIVGGRTLVKDGRHVSIPDVGDALRKAVGHVLAER